ncbi:putative fluoride ion transporter CrcB 2 [Ktedonobacter sp. SOSP1-85]|uniref:fluoride efflux transporter FluC n=1 Tax=Ktedonobacter sp. SOSP1-85 TaxID=2778367 RepID=UPI00191534DA|nr:CrcB family protein [Ktedonobacter sp. SOSP1-85]GHO73360.1 putative fluoride ion transporter CrcB 2 [Ktedonobacter sp. SOSP1-85]
MKNRVTLRQLVAVLTGGFLGTMTRYLLSLAIQQALGKGWPFDILLINITGALLIALISTLAETTMLLGPTRRLFLVTGFLGAYTTFSSLALGTLNLLNGGATLPAFLYLLTSLLGGLFAIVLGVRLGQGGVSWLKKRQRMRSLGLYNTTHSDERVLEEEHRV